jgi:hypothetical protein
MVKILTIDSEIESARKLGFVCESWFSSHTETFDNDVVVRWGNSGLHESVELRRREFKNVINKAGAIRLNCHKKEALLKIAEVADIPKIFEVKVPDNISVVYRPQEHSGGRGFNVIKGPFEIDSCYYATEYIKTDIEYRVWFAGNETLCAKRVPLSSTIVGMYPCRSQWGYSFCKEVPKVLHDKTLLAAQKIGLELGAADVLFHGKKYYFLELNSAPTIDTSKLKAFYTRNIKKVAEEKFPKCV